MVTLLTPLFCTWTRAGVITEALKRDWQSRRKARHSRNRPTLGQTIGFTEQLFKRHFVVVADDEIVLQVERRNHVFLAEIKGIDLLLNAGGPVHRLAVSVAGQQRQTACGSLERRLQAVVVSVARVLVNR